MLAHLDLFSGIGGNSLAFEAEGFTTIGFSEIEPYCLKVLTKHWPHVPNLGPVQNITRDSVLERTGVLPLVITGGFPCQPHSIAGKRKGSKDDRELWPECVRVLGELRPRFALFENTAAITTSDSGEFVNGMYADLARLGYSCLRTPVPASAVGAPHLRWRQWFLCVENSGCQHGKGKEKQGETRKENQKRTAVESQRPTGWNRVWVNPDTESERRSASGDARGRRNGFADIPNDIAGERKHEITKQNWDKNWIEVALTTCVRGVDYGLSRKLHRTARLNALGNSIVPQVAQIFARAIRRSMTCGFCGGQYEAMDSAFR